MARASTASAGAGPRRAAFLAGRSFADRQRLRQAEHVARREDPDDQAGVAGGIDGGGQRPDEAVVQLDDRRRAAARLQRQLDLDPAAGDALLHGGADPRLEVGERLRAGAPAGRGSDD